MAFYQQNDSSFGTATQLSGSGLISTGQQPSALSGSNNRGLVSSATIASGPDDVIKSQFQAPEGTYKLMTLAEYSRPSRVPLNPHQGNNVPGNAPVRVSFVLLPDASECGCGPHPYICFNVGRELFVYPYGISIDLARPLDKRVYKGTLPTYHEFNQCCATSDSCQLLIGFSLGQVQIIDPFRKDYTPKLFNDEQLQRQAERTRVTCVRWIPGSPSQFLAAHASGNMYVYNGDEPGGSEYGGGSSSSTTSVAPPPNFAPFKNGDGWAVHVCKNHSCRQPMFRWTVGRGDAVNEFAFSPDGRLLATAGQDGFLRIFNFHAVECVGVMRSYFGGLLCVAWSPDLRLVATGGEDDLISVYSVPERRLVCRGQGHKSWVSQVSFDQYLTRVYDSDGSDFHLDSEEDLRSLNLSSNDTTTFQRYRWSMSGRSPAAAVALSRTHKDSIGSGGGGTQGGQTACCLTYRIGSVGHDTLLCFWDVSEDVLKPSGAGRIRTSVILNNSPLAHSKTIPGATGLKLKTSAAACTEDAPAVAKDGTHRSGATTGHKFKRHFLGFRMMGSGSGGGEKSRLGGNCHGSGECTAVAQVAGQTNNAGCKLLGSVVCPLMNEVPVIEPTVTKKIAHERLSVLIFREDTIITACQEGFVCTWARPGRFGLNLMQRGGGLNSPNPAGSTQHVSSNATVV